MKRVLLQLTEVTSLFVSPPKGEGCCSPWMETNDNWIHFWLCRDTQFQCRPLKTAWRESRSQHGPHKLEFAP